MKKIEFKVLNMHCPNCAMILESIEDELVGIQNISASYHKQMLIVEYDENKIGVAEIEQAARQKGYILSSGKF